MIFDRGWPALAAAAAAGVVAAFGQAPYDLPLAMFLGIGAVLWLAQHRVSPWEVALTGWAFGTGYFAHALQWIVSPFMVDVARHGWMAPFALLFMAAGLALFWGGAFWLARRLSSRMLWFLAVTWPAMELLRAYIFTGFPWAMFSQAMVDTPLAPILAWGGPYVLNLIVMIASAGVAIAAAKGWIYVVVVAALFGAGLYGLPDLSQRAVLTDHWVRLIQPNAPQHEKWDPERIPEFFERQLGFTAAPAADGETPDLILWPETAIPWSLQYAQTPLAQIAEAGGSATVALGVLRRDDLRLYNAMAVLNQSGGVAQTYDKHHLVPFGEYLPFGSLLAKLGIYGLAAEQGAGYSVGPGAQVLDFGPLGKALPLICYEAVFPHDVNAAPERPDFIMQLTNDAWFGRGAGPEQHLAQARMRAIEQGLPVARTANTGISAMIDPYGRVIASLPLNQPGFIDAPLPAPLAPTLYSRAGDLPFAGFVILCCAVFGLRARRS